MTTRTLLKACFYVGVLADLVATLPLVFPQVAQAMFGAAPGPDPLTRYVGDVAASLMLGWTILLFWGSRRPEQRRGLLLLTVCPVLLGLLLGSVRVVAAGGIAMRFMVPLWVFYAIIIPAYLVAYVRGGRARD